MKKLKGKKIKSWDEIPKIVKRDVEELNMLSDGDLLSILSFFKFLVTDIKKKDKLIFLTRQESIVGRYRDILEKKGIKVKFMEELTAM